MIKVHRVSFSRSIFQQHVQLCRKISFCRHYALINFLVWPLARASYGYDNEMFFTTIQIDCIEQLSLVEMRNKTNMLRTTNTSAERPFVAPGATNQQQSLVDSFAFHPRENNLSSISFVHPADLCLG